MKKALGETQTLRASCVAKYFIFAQNIRKIYFAEPKIFAPPQTPSRGCRTAKI